MDALSAFREIKRFLDEHPDEVLIIDIEDYVTPRDMVALLEESGLANTPTAGGWKRPCRPSAR